MAARHRLDAAGRPRRSWRWWGSCAGVERVDELYEELARRGSARSSVWGASMNSGAADRQPEFIGQMGRRRGVSASCGGEVATGWALPLAYATPKDPPMDITLQHPDLADSSRRPRPTRPQSRSRTCPTAGTAPTTRCSSAGARAAASAPPHEGHGRPTPRHRPLALPRWLLPPPGMRPPPPLLGRGRGARPRPLVRRALLVPPNGTRPGRRSWRSSSSSVPAGAARTPS